MAVSEKTIDRLVNRLNTYTQNANDYFIKKMGEAISQIRELSPSDAHKLVQMLKYGGSYQDLVRELSNISGIPKKEIEEIFYNYAKIDQNFYEKFYKYRNIKYVPFDQNLALKRQTRALAEITAGEFKNFTRSRALGYTFKDKKGNVRFHGLRETYERLLDEAVLNVGQGKESFNASMDRILKEIGGSGLRTLDYDSGRSYRLDSMVDMHLRSALNNLHNENQKIIAEEIGADGVEISVHEMPAPDHEEVQGRQFSNKEYDKLQAGSVATTYQGQSIQITHSKNGSFRPISEYNCFHYTFAIVLGVSKPQYNDQQLQDIIDTNNKGFELDGKHYTNYQGSQLQRTLERKIREQQDIQMLAQESGNESLAIESQRKVNQLLGKYKELSVKSGIPMNTSRLSTTGYRPLAKKKLK